jgi:hypothetical protein
MLYMSQLRMGDKFTLNGSDAVFKFTHKSSVCSHSPPKYIYHATLEGVHCMFNDILVNKVEKPREPEQIAIVYSVEDVIANRAYLDVLKKHKLKFLGWVDTAQSVQYRNLETGKRYNTTSWPIYGRPHTIWLTEFIDS